MGFKDDNCMSSKRVSSWHEPDIPPHQLCCKVSVGGYFFLHSDSLGFEPRAQQGSQPKRKENPMDATTFNAVTKNVGEFFATPLIKILLGHTGFFWWKAFNRLLEGADSPLLWRTEDIWKQVHIQGGRNGTGLIVGCQNSGYEVTEWVIP